MITLIEAVCAFVVLVRVICVASAMSRKKWNGRPLAFYGMAASYALVMGGAAGTALKMEHGPMLLLMGAAGWVIFERRRAERRT